MDKLNGKFESESEYFHQAVDFLEQYKWIFHSANTHILVDQVPECVPKQWDEFVNFANWKRVEIATKGFDQPFDWPDQLITFLNRCRDLSLRMEAEKEFAKGDKSDRKWNKVNPKKIHEVVNLARLIGESCQNNEVKHVVDIGAGLGYLDRELSDRYQLHVLGLEQDSYRVTTANQRSTSTGEDCGHKAVFKELTLRSQDDLEDQMNAMIDNWFHEISVQPSEAVPLCAVGLHACGDLSPTMLQLFLKNRRRPFHSLFLVSCCYHRMAINNDSQFCSYFPMSRSMTCQMGGGSRFLQGHHLIYFLRLAAQETTNRWLNESLERNNQLHNTFYRAVLQLYAVRDDIQLRKQHRKAVKKVEQLTTFEEYVDQAITGFGLQGDSQVHRRNLIEIYQQQMHKLSAVETLIILQVLLQPVAEALLLIDRMVYLQENGARVTLEQVFDDRISPRCFATVAEKM